MRPTLDTLIDRGCAYVARCARITAPEKRERALRRHSDTMRDLPLDQAEALLAAVIGAVKAHQRDTPGDAYYLRGCLDSLQDAAASLANHFGEVEGPFEPQPERLSGVQLGLLELV